MQSLMSDFLKVGQSEMDNSFIHVHHTDHRRIGSISHKDNGELEAPMDYDHSRK